MRPGRSGLAERPRLGTADEGLVQDGKNSAPGSRLCRGRRSRTNQVAPGGTCVGSVTETGLPLSVQFTH
jgi:hypothetical protein